MTIPCRVIISVRTWDHEEQYRSTPKGEFQHLGGWKLRVTNARGPVDDLPSAPKFSCLWIKTFSPPARPCCEASGINPPVFAPLPCKSSRPHAVILKEPARSLASR